MKYFPFDTLSCGLSVGGGSTGESRSETVTSFSATNQHRAGDFASRVESELSSHWDETRQFERMDETIIEYTRARRGKGDRPLDSRQTKEARTGAKGICFTNCEKASPTDERYTKRNLKPRPTTRCVFMGNFVRTYFPGRLEALPSVFFLLFTFLSLCFSLCSIYPLFLFSRCPILGFVSR